MRQLRLLMAAAITAAMILVMSGVCAADVMMSVSTTAPSYGPLELPVTLANGQTGATVTGTLSNSAVVDFTTNVDVLYNGAVNGTPAVRAEDNSINNLTITLPGFTFTDAIFNIYGVYTGHEAITITVNLSDGVVTQALDLHSGQTSRNWVTIEAFNNETINSITINDAKFYALEDSHISGPASTTSPVPEPASLALVLSGLIGVGSKLRRRNRKSSEVTL